MARVLTGTSTISAAGTTVTAWSGATLTEINCPAGSPVSIEGMVNFVKERLSVTSFEVELAHQGAGGTTLSTAISAFTPVEVSAGTLNARTAQVIQELNTLDANGRGLFYNLIGVTGDNDPGPGNVAMNDDAIASVTELYIDILDANEANRDVSGIMDLWKSGTVITIRSLASTSYATFVMGAAVLDKTGYYLLSVSYQAGSGTLASEPVSLDWSITGEGIAIDAEGSFAGRDTYDDEAARFVYASVNGADGGGAPTVLYIKNSATSADWGPAIPFQGDESSPRVAITFWDPGRPAAGELLCSILFDVPVDFPANFSSLTATSQSRAIDTATLDSSITFRKNGTQFGTLTFASGDTSGTFSSTATSFAAGEYLDIYAPSTRDATLARISFTLAGER